MKYSLSSDTWDKEELQAIQDVIDSGRYTMGPKVAQFEKEFAEKFDVPYAVMVNSGSTANLLMWSCLVNKDQLHGDVIVPAVSWSTTYFPLLQNRFTPNFVDVDLDTLNLDVTKIEEAITENTVGIFAVNLLGNSCDYSKILKLCQKYKLELIEDNCESLGAVSNATFREGDSIKVRKCGTVGRMGSFSFFFSHHMQTMEGGMVVVDSQEDADWLKSLRAHGWVRDLSDNNPLFQKTGAWKDNFTFVTPGYAIRPLEFSGAIGSEQLKKWPSMVKARMKNKEYFFNKFADKPWIRLQKETQESSWFSFGCIMTGSLKGRRDEVVTALSKAGVQSRPLASGNWLKQPVLQMQQFDAKGLYEGAEEIESEGFFVGNGVQDIKEGIDVMHDTIEKLI